MIEVSDAVANMLVNNTSFGFMRQVSYVGTLETSFRLETLNDVDVL